MPNWSLHNAQWQNYWWVKNPTGFRRKQWWPSGYNIPEYTERNWGKQRKPQAGKPITWKKILTSPSYPRVFKTDSFKSDAHQNVVSDYLKLLQVLLFQCNISPLYEHSFLTDYFYYETFFFALEGMFSLNVSDNRWGLQHPVFESRQLSTMSPALVLHQLIRITVSTLSVSWSTLITVLPSTWNISNYIKRVPRSVTETGALDISRVHLYEHTYICVPDNN